MLLFAFTAAAWTLLSFEDGVLANNVCDRFRDWIPCIEFGLTTPKAYLSPEEKYCARECAQIGYVNFKSPCQCGDAPTSTTTVPSTTSYWTTTISPNSSPTTTADPSTTSRETTTPLPTTTTVITTTMTPEPPGHCYYTLTREPQLIEISKRLYDADPVAVQCQYPGIVGMFNADGRPMCTGILLDTETVLVDSICVKYIKYHEPQILVDSYYFKDLSTTRVISSSTKQIDSYAPELSTAKLNSPVEFDEKCVQPACVPNPDIISDDIDFDDCRFVGYGYQQNLLDYPEQRTEQLMELEVTVSKSSIYANELSAARKIGDPRTGPCFFDDSAPLICSHTVTLEWIVVGITTSIAYPCETGEEWTFIVKNLLQEAKNPIPYDELQDYPYTSRHS